MDSRDVSELYDACYFATGCGRPYDRDEKWLRFFDAIAERIIRDIQPSTVLDAGCAMGFLVEALRQRGVEAFGLDVSKYAIQNVHPDIQSYCWTGSVTDPLPRTYDLIVCIEVLEHLPPREAEQAVENLCRHADDILFSSTPLDYKEPTHSNVQPPEYWAELFARHGFFRDVDFDASFITPWAVRFRKTHEPVARVIAAYERRFWRLLQENQARREFSIEQRNELAEKKREVQALKAQAEEKEREVEAVKAEMAEKVQSLRAQVREWEMRWARLESSIGWALLRRLQYLRLRVAPPGSRRERLLEAMFRLLQMRNREAFIGLMRLIMREIPWQAKVLLRKAQSFVNHWPQTQLVQIAPNESHQLWIAQNEPSKEELERQKRESLSFEYRPKISIITPVWNTDERWLKLAIESVLNQTYDNWELCIADGNSAKSHVKKVLQEYAEKDSRIKVKFLPENKGIAGNSNEALSLATGEFIGLLDHDDELAPFALYEVAKLLNEKPKADFIYSDEDKITPGGKRIDHFFKPDWSPDMFLSCMYTGHFGVYRKKIVDQIGGFRSGYEGSQDYDLVLRFIERTDEIYHVPKILYHWRVLPQSAAFGPGAKPEAYVAAKKAIGDYLVRNDIEGEVTDGAWTGSYRVKRRIIGNPLVSIIIPTRDKVAILKRCIEAILEKTDYVNYEILVVDNQSVETETWDYYDGIKKHPKVGILEYDKPFNFSAMNNYAASQAHGEHILFLNNDTEVITGEWLSSMLEHSQRKEVGAVGCLLLYPNNKIQHAGVIIGLGGVAGHSHKQFHSSNLGYFGRPHLIQNLSGVTAACMILRKEVFKEVGGFDDNLSFAFNDVDLCLKIRERGYLIVYTPYAQLYHYESYSRGYEDTPEKQARFLKEIEYVRARWGHLIDKGDPYYNPNLTLDRGDFSLRIRRAM